MKKIILLFTFLLYSSLSHSQLALEGFESTTGPDVSSTNWTLGTGNWAVFDNGIGLGQRWGISTTNVCSGNQIAYMNREFIGQGNTSEDYLATPLVSIPANGELHFQTRTFANNNQGTIFQIRVAPATAVQTNPAAYTLVQQWDETTLTAVYNICEEKIVDLSAYAGQQVYVSFAQIFTQPTASLGGDRWLVDNVSINTRCLVPTTLTATGITFNGMNLSWANPSGATSWEIEFLPAGDTVTGVGVVYNGTLPYVVTGLLPNTAYKYYVRALCDTGYSSVWSPVSNTFTTTTAPPVCGGNFVDVAGPTTNYANNSDSTVTICPLVAGDLVTVTFTSFTTEATYDALYVFNGNAITSPIIASANGAGNVPGGLAGGYWGTTIPGPFTSSSPDGCLTFRFRSDDIINLAGWIADVTCAPPPTCLQPLTPITTTAITANTVTLGWTNAGIATAWQVLALPCGSPAPTGASTGWVDAPTNPFTMTGLNSYTCYSFYVRGVCSPTDSSFWSGPKNATTLIAPAICNGNYVDSGGPTANYANNANITTTVCPDNVGDAVTVTFASFNVQANFDFVRIYNGNDATAPLIATLTGTALPPSFTSSAANGCLTFVFTSNASVTATGFLANLSCSPAPTCPKPVLLTAANITSSSVTFGWTSTGTETAWQVIALPCTAPAPNASTTGWVDAPTNPFNLTTGLSASACFNLYVRAVCSPTDVSNWSAPLSITTPIAPPVCGGIFVDNAGPNGNYANNSDSTVTICPINTGDLVTVTFTAFNTEPNWDALYVFDGDTITSAQLSSTNPAGTVPGGLAGGYWGAALPGPFTSSSPTGCLTFRFRSDGANNQGGWLANITCTPAPTCPRPTAVIASGQTQTGATFAWTEVGSATTWEVIVLPQGTSPNASSVGTITTNNPYTVTGLTSGTLYTCFIRAICSSTDSSAWTFGSNFNTLISNDECTGALPVTVNPNVFCTQVTSGTLLGATASSQTNACGGTDDDDVWFSFVAVTTSHTININDIAGSTIGLYHVVYSGACGALTQVSCNTNTASTANNLVIGQTYYIRVYSSTATPNQNSTFNVCVGTIPPPIATNTTQYTTAQLIQDILLNTTCASVTNITSSTGTNFGSTNGIGYFSENGSGFPFSDGIVLTTGNAANAHGPNNSVLSEGATTWTGDAQLEAIILAATGTPMVSRNATKLEFDFIPLVSNISFNFLFASEEYGTFQCGFSDSFAFLLTNIATGVTTNLAVIPNTTIPVSVVTIRDGLFNGGCASANPEYFGNFYGAAPGLNVLADPINFNGLTVPLTATSPVTPGTQYHIKLVIADQADTLFDSAVFLEGGSLDIGNVELGNDFLQSTGNALCSGSSYTIESGLDPATYTFSWTFNGNPVPNETGANLTITEQGIYGIAAQYTNTTCAATDTITIEYYPAVTIGTPNNLIACNNIGFAEFDLTQNDVTSLNGLDSSQHTISYYLTSTDATAETNPLPSLYTNVVQNLQTVYVRLENNVSGCFATSSFNLIVNPLVVPTFTIVNAVCQDSVPFALPTTSDNNIAGAWSPDVVNTTLETVYTFTPNVGTCGDVITKTIAITPTITPITAFMYTSPVCKNGINPTPSPSTGFTAGGMYSYAETSGLSINTSTGVIDLTNSTAGTYNVIYTVLSNSSICQVTHSDSYPITINPIVTPVTAFGYTSPVCPGGTNPMPIPTGGFTIDGAYSSTTGLDIDAATGEVNSTTSTPGTYTITYSVLPNTSICQIGNSDTAVLVISNPIEVSISGECVGVNYILTANPIANSFDPLTSSYVWKDSSLNPIGGNTQSVTVTEEGQYSVTVISNGCNGYASFTPDSVTCVIQKGISVNNTPDGLNDCLELQGYNVEKLSIFNRYGLKVYSKKNYTNQWCGQSDNGDSLPDGTYYYVIERTNGETKTGWIYINKE